MDFSLNSTGHEHTYKHTHIHTSSQTHTHVAGDCLLTVMWRLYFHLCINRESVCVQLEAFESNCWPDCYITVNNKINASTKIPRNHKGALDRPCFCVWLAGELLLKFWSQSPSRTVAESDECLQLKSNKMDLVGTAAPAHSLIPHLSLSLSLSLCLMLPLPPSNTHAQSLIHQRGSKSVVCSC